MVRAWYMTEVKEGDDQREPHLPDNPRFIDVSELKENTGVEYFSCKTEGHETDEAYCKLRKDRGYNYEDVCEISRETLPNYDEKLKIFFKEHLHADEEVRFCLAGSGYFDVRDGNDEWIRVEFGKDDLLVLPAGIYHRFTLDSTNYIKCKRLFCGDPVWTPLSRPADEHPSRLGYLKAMVNA